MQGFPGKTTTAGFDAMVGRAAAVRRRASPGRGPGAAPASDLYATAYAAHDLADVIRALHAGPVDLYGDSYGSWFAQSFASRYPHLLRSVVLDSTYSLVHLSPWYASSATTARTAFPPRLRPRPGLHRAGRRRPVAAADAARRASPHAPRGGMDAQPPGRARARNGVGADDGRSDVGRGLRPAALPRSGRGRPGGAARRHPAAAASRRRGRAGRQRDSGLWPRTTPTGSTSPSPASTIRSSSTCARRFAARLAQLRASIRTAPAAALGRSRRGSGCR